MQRIVVLTDSHRYVKGVYEFAEYISALTNSEITGVLIDPGHLSEAEYTGKECCGKCTLKNQTADRCEPAMTKNADIKLPASFNFHRSLNWLNTTASLFSAEQIIEESRFADLLLIPSKFTKQTDQKAQDFFLKIMKEAECPVVIASENFETVDELVFSYDGTEAAAYAIKQFTYLFPQLSETKAIFLLSDKKNEFNTIDHRKIGDYLKAHYSAVGFQQGTGELDSILTGKKNTLVVTGSHSQANASEDIANHTIQKINYSLFISQRASKIPVLAG